MRARVFLAAALALAACGDGTGAGTSDAVTRLAPALQPLVPEDLDREGITGAGCWFQSGGKDDRLVLAADPLEAIARIDGRIVRFTTSGALETARSLFENEGMSIRVERTAGAERPIEEGVIVPARLVLADRGAGRRQDVDGTWTCGA